MTGEGGGAEQTQSWMLFAIPFMHQFVGVEFDIAEMRGLPSSFLSSHTLSQSFLAELCIVTLLKCLPHHSF